MLVRSVLLVVAHPDDEMLAAGIQMGRWESVTILHVTDGSPRDLSDARQHGFSSAAEYAAARRRELEAALRVGGLTNVELHELGVPDKEARHHVRDIQEKVERLSRRVDLVLTHPYEGGHPDHDACAEAVAGIPGAPWEFASYHAAPDGSLRTGEFLGDISRQVEYRLTPEEQLRKEAILACFASQRETLGLFRIEAERFRPALSYDFSQPPNGGSLYYDRFGWDLS